MIPFTVIALALAAVAVAMLLPALRHRTPPPTGKSRDALNIHIARQRLQEVDTAGDNPAATQSREEIEAALLADLGADTAADPPTDPIPSAPPPPTRAAHTAWTVAILTLIPLAATALYLALGTPAALNSAATIATIHPPGTDLPPLEELLEKLEARLAAEPDNPDGWALAGSTYMALGHFVQAENAYRRLHGLVGDDPDVLAAWSDAGVMVENGTFTPDIMARLNRALALNPQHPNALWLAALGAESNRNYTQTLGYLRRLLPLTEEDAESHARVQQFIERMEQAGG